MIVFRLTHLNRALLVNMDTSSLDLRSSMQMSPNIRPCTTVKVYIKGKFGHVNRDNDLVCFILLLFLRSRSNLLWWIESDLSTIKDRCNPLVHHFLEGGDAPNGGQYNSTIESLWISHRVDSLPLNLVMLAHMASANSASRVRSPLIQVTSSLLPLMLATMAIELPSSIPNH